MTRATEMTPLLNVEDVERSAAFYRDVLGLPVVSSWQDEGRRSTRALFTRRRALQAGVCVGSTITLLLAEKNA
jgi:catechol 2,3-dioxygenase-like lactoylglutathione lyase family enzyme